MEKIKATKREIIDTVNRTLPMKNKIVIQENAANANVKTRYLITEQQLTSIIQQLIRENSC